MLTHLDQGRRPRRQRAVVRLKPVRKIPVITRDFVQNLVWVCSIYRNCLWRERPGSSAARISTHSFTNAVWPLIINIDWETLHKKQLRSATIHGTLATRSSIRRQHSQQITDESDAFCLFLFQLYATAVFVQITLIFNGIVFSNKNILFWMPLVNICFNNVEVCWTKLKFLKCFDIAAQSSLAENVVLQQ